MKFQATFNLHLTRILSISFQITISIVVYNNIVISFHITNF